MTEHVVSKKAAAAFFRVSTQALDNWFTAGCPVRERDEQGRIKAVCLEDLAEWRIGRVDADGNELERERTRLTKAQADKTELEVAELQGTLIRVPAVTAHWQSKVASVRARLLSLPTKLASAIAPPDRLGAAQDQSQALIYEALAELAGDGIPDDVRERSAAIGRSRDRHDVAPAAAADHQPVGGGKPGAQRGRQRRARKVSAE